MFEFSLTVTAICSMKNCKYIKTDVTPVWSHIRFFVTFFDHAVLSKRFLTMLLLTTPF